MKKTLCGASALLVLVFALAGHAQTAPADPNVADPSVVVRGQRAVKHPHKWVRAESTHFVVYSDAARPDVETFVAKMERFWLMLRIFSHASTDVAPDAPKEVLYYLADEQALGQIDPQSPEYAIGLYTSCPAAQTGFGVHMYYQENHDQALEKRPENEGLGYIYQAYARDFFHRRAMAGAPLWFVEGYAQYFSTTRFDGNEVVLGMAPNALAILLQRLGNGYMYSLDYADVLLGNNSRGHNQAGVAGLGNEFEARSWVLTHWILSNKDNLAHFQAYIKLIEAGEDRIKAFKTAFGLTPGGLNHVLWVYVRKLEAIKFQVKSGTTPDPDIAIAQMPQSAERLLMTEAALKTCPSDARGKSLLNTARTEAARYPGDAYAQTVLARAEAGFGDTTEALTLLDPLIAQSPHDATLLALKGQALMRAGRIADAVAILDKAGGLSPRTPEIAYAFSLAEAQNVGGFDTDAANAAVAAYLYAPQVEAFAWRAGLAYAWLGQPDEGAKALRVVADNPRPSALAPLAQAWQAKIATASKTELSAAASQPLPVAPKVAVTAREDWTYASADVLNALDLAVSQQNAGLDPDLPNTPPTQP